MKRIIGQQNSYVTVILVHSTMYPMIHNHYKSVWVGHNAYRAINITQGIVCYTVAVNKNFVSSP